MKIKMIEKSLDAMAPEELQKGITRWLNAGSNDADRDHAINAKVARTLQKKVEKAAKKNA